MGKKKKLKLLEIRQKMHETTTQNRLKMPIRIHKNLQIDYIHPVNLTNKFLYKKKMKPFDQHTQDSK